MSPCSHPICEWRWCQGLWYHLSLLKFSGWNFIVLEKKKELWWRWRSSTSYLWTLNRNLVSPPPRSLLLMCCTSKTLTFWNSGFKCLLWKPIDLFDQKLYIVINFKASYCSQSSYGLISYQYSIYLHAIPQGQTFSCSNNKLQVQYIKKLPLHANTMEKFTAHIKVEKVWKQYFMNCALTVKSFWDITLYIFGILMLKGMRNRAV